MNSSQPALSAGGSPAEPWAEGGAALAGALPSLLAAAGVASLAGNLLLLAVLAYQLRRGTVSGAHALALNLCAADLTLALYCLPPRIVAYARGSWLLGGFLCRTADWLLHSCLVAKSLTWAAVGHARRKEAVSARPASPSQGPGRSWGRLAAVLASLWAAALLLPLPHLLFTRVEPGQPRGRLCCDFAAPARASRFVDVFSKAYPLLACLAPSGFACSCYWRALRGPGAGKPRLAKAGRQKREGTWALLGLTLLFHATWLPAWTAWLWKRHRALGEGGPPPALAFAADLLLSLDGALGPGLFLRSAGDLRRGLRHVCRALWCGGGGGQDREGARSSGRAGATLPDVEHFWKDRRSIAVGEESDPVPWEHQSDP
ncbi:G-protein coupled receptor 151 protein-like [Candoia aspera]|uniref:G-protein coupled receptor 151 protein-like n=1 Tax=Candoia aspera TaxID=51853 RepID=UPI002FD7EE55